MASGERTVKIKFTGDRKDLARAAAGAGRDLEKFKSGADTVGSNMGKSIASSLSSSGIYGAAAIVAAIIAAAPLLGAAVSAGVLLAFGGGILALGIASAVKDPKVAEAFTGLKTQAAEVFKKFGEPFKGPLIESAKIFGDLLTKSIGPALERMGKVVAPLVTILAQGFADMAKNSLPGVEAAVKASVPLFQILAKSAPEFGAAISKFLEAVAKGGPGAAAFLKDVMNFLVFILPKVGALVGWLSNQYINWRNGVIMAIAAAKSAWNSFYSFFSNIGNKVGSAIAATGNAFISFKNKIVGAWNSIVNAISAAVNKITGLINRLRNLASTAINFTVGGLGGLFGGFRASGGSVMSGRTYMVGEKGPELFTPGTGGRITPNSALGGDEDRVYEFTFDLGHGITERFRIHDRDLKRRARVA